MNFKPDHQGNRNATDNSINLLAARADELRLALSQRPISLLASNTLATLSLLHPNGTGEFCLDLWDRPISISYPEFAMLDVNSSQSLNPGIQALILYYFFTADGANPTGEWISFSNLQDGRFYTQAFEGYTGRELAKTFQNDQISFARAASLLNGRPYSLGDSAFEFNALPKIHLLVVQWQGDEDFPPNYQILFDASVNHFLPTDACAIAGSMLAKKLIKIHT